MMMDAEMYGMMPSAKIPKRASAPPENRLNSASMLPACWSKKLASAFANIYCDKKAVCEMKSLDGEEEEGGGGGGILAPKALAGAAIGYAIGKKLS